MPRPPDAKTVFKKHFGYTPTHVVQAPARLELLGNHTDYNQGLVLSLAVDRYLSIASAPRTDGKIELISSAFPGKHRFWLSEFKKDPAAPWADYVKGVLHHLRRRGVHFSGFNAAIHSDIPIGAGLSSSAALAVATALTVRQLYPHRLTETGSALPPKRDRRGKLPELTSKERLQIARICQAAENDFAGVQSGLLDPISSLFGQEFHAVLIDFMHVSVERISLAGEIAVILCDSGVSRELADGRYNELRAECESAARALGVPSLRRIEPRTLRANQGKLTERQFQCAYHIVGENQRVLFGERALREGDFVQFGQYLFQSHESSRDFFRNSSPELDLLVELAREHPACLGARLTGGGFGGATINLVHWRLADEFMQAMAAQYEARTGRKLTPQRCRIVKGAE